MNSINKNALQKAFDRSPSGIIDEVTKDMLTIDSINLSEIYTQLIQNTGRFVEKYASDLIIGINSMRKDIESLCNSDTEYAEIWHSFGLRKKGVDHEAYILNRTYQAIKQNDYGFLSNYYRRIYVLKTTKRKIKETYTFHIFTCEIRDITTKISLSDLRTDISSS